jgi:glycosyltransferase involved in cell wall biosynthesis
LELGGTILKILLVNYMETLYPGGINKTVKELAKNFSNRGHDVTVIQPKIFDFPSNEIYDGFRILRINSWTFKHLYGFNFVICRHVKKFIKEFKPDIVHIHGCHNLFPVELLYYLGKSSKKSYKLVFSPHLDVANSTFAGKYLWKFYEPILKRVLNFADSIVAASKFEANNLISYGIDDREKIQIIGHGVDELDHHPKDSSDKEIKLLYVGHLIERKGVKHIIECMDFLINKRKFKDVTLTIIGEGPQKKALKELADNYQIKDSIVWKSFLNRSRLINEIRQADVLLLLSESEAYGIIVAESLAYGTPVIVTKRTALREFLEEPGCFGVDYPPKKAEVADLIIKIYKGNVKVGPFSEKIRQWTKVVEDYEDLYLSLMK